MFRQAMKLEVKKNERDYTLALPEGCNLGELVDVLCDMRAIAFNALQNAIEKENPNPEEKNGD